MNATLAVDVGQTGSRFLLQDSAGGRETWQSAAGRAGGVPEDGLVAALEEAAAGVGSSPPLETLAAGLTGLQGRAARAEEVLERVGRFWPVQRVVLADDALTSYVGALGLRAGAVVSAGTGAVTLASDGVAQHARVDGWGYLAGDLGSGYWIGRRGLESALRELDGRAGSAVLLRLARETYDDVETLPVRLAGDADRVRSVAVFAERVADAARAGDPVSRGIWAEAAAHLADSVVAACGRAGLAGSIEVSWTGRLFAAGDVLAEPFAAAIRERLPQAVLTPPDGDGLQGAALLAMERSLPPFGPLLTSAVRETMPA